MTGILFAALVCFSAVLFGFVCWNVKAALELFDEGSYVAGWGVLVFQLGTAAFASYYTYPVLWHHYGA